MPSIIDLRRSTIVWLLILNVAVFAVTWLSGISAEWLGVSAQAEELLYRPWTPLTYMVTHIDGWHLLVNMLWLWFFGRLLEHVGSPSRLLIIYLIGGLAGATIYVVCWTLAGGSGVLLGASAAVTTVMVAAGISAPGLRVNLFLLGEVKLKWVVLAGVVILLLGAGGGGYVAHLGGLAAGFSTYYWHRIPKLFIKLQSALFRHKQAAKGRKLRNAIELRRRDMDRLDSLLDRVRISGFDSLSGSERQELKTLSERLTPHQGNDK